MLTVGTFAPFTYGKGLSKKIRNETGSVPVFGSNGIIGYHDKSLTSGPTIIIGRKGTVGAVHYSPVPCWPIDTTFYITESNGQKLRFKYYLLKSLGLNLMNSDSAVPGLNREAAHAIRIAVPSDMEQQFISSFLGDLDNKIELNRRMNETLEEMAQALFKSWFVGFDPVQAKMDGRWQPGQSLPGLPAELYDLFPDRLLPSELGEIPKGWQVKSLDEIANFTNGLALQKFPSTGEEYLPVIKIAEMRRGYTKSTGKASSEIDHKYIVEDGDLLFSWSGSLEVVLWTHGRGALNQHLFKVSSVLFPKWFYWGWTKQHLAEFRQIAASKATTMGHIQRHHLKEALVVVPSEDVLTVGDQIIMPFLAQYVTKALESRSLARLRDMLLPKLLSGEIRVDDLENLPE